MTSVNKTIQVPGTQFCNTPSVHCVVCLPPQVKFPLSPLLKKEKTHGHGKQCGDCWSEGRWRKVSGDKWLPWKFWVIQECWLGLVVGLWRLVENFHNLNQVVILNASAFIGMDFSLEQTAPSLTTGLQLLLWKMLYCLCINQEAICFHMVRSTKYIDCCFQL